MFKYCALISLCACACLAGDFVSGQGARLVIGQSTFTQQQPGASDTLLGGAGGVAYAADTLFLSDANRVGLTPENNRVLMYTNLSQNFPQPLAPLPPYSSRCPVCVGKASIVVGQPDFTSTDYHATPNGLRQPSGVASDGHILAVADTENNRILIWRSIPQLNGQPADIVLGQPDMNTVLPQPQIDAKSLRAPQGVWIENGKFFVADTLHHRVLIWNTIPTSNNQAADVVVGQPNFNSANEPSLTDATLGAQANTLLNPVSVTSDGIHMFVADLGHNRILIWNAIPTQNYVNADVVLGQQDMVSAIPNNSFTGAPAISSTDTTNKETPVMCTVSNGKDQYGNPTYPILCEYTMDFPRFALSDGRRLFVADGGNDRVLIYNRIPTQNNTAADIVLGQPDFITSQITSTTDLFHPLLKQSAADVTPTPTSLAWDGTNLFVADPSNRRVLVFTPEQALIPINGVRNAASMEVFALGSVTLGGSIVANDTVTVTITPPSTPSNSSPTGTGYTYKIVSGDTFETVFLALVGLINAGNGNPNVFAEYVPSLTLLKLIARTPGPSGNNIGISTSVSTGAQITATASGSTLQGGQDAAIVAPGTIVALIGTNLADAAVAADMSQASLPIDLGGVEIYFDGIRSPLFFVSPTQINAQVPYEVQDSNSISCYVRIQHADGTVTATTALGVSIAHDNGQSVGVPGLFAGPGQDPRPAMAVHSSSYATGLLSIDGTVTAGDTATITIGGRAYYYTSNANDTLESVRDGLISLINSNPEEKVTASAAGAFTRIYLQAKIPGPEGNGIPLTTSASVNATIVLTATNPTMCCANVAGAAVTANNPAVPGEIIRFYATGLGLISPPLANQAIVTGAKYNGPPVNDPVTFVSALINNTTANVVSAGLMVGSVGVYEVLLELGGGTTPSPAAQVTISQDIYTSNVVTIPVSNPLAPTP
jgi:uncharacterized protein (TIGR03437 family)